MQTLAGPGVAAAGEVSRFASSRHASPAAAAAAAAAASDFDRELLCGAQCEVPLSPGGSGALGDGSGLVRPADELVGVATLRLKAVGALDCSRGWEDDRWWPVSTGGSVRCKVWYTPPEDGVLDGDDGHDGGDPDAL
jgi:hypothetical protein